MPYEKQRYKGDNKKRQITGVCYVAKGGDTGGDDTIMIWLW
jgi:hypothetical protein